MTLSPYYPMPYFSIYDTPLGQAKPQPLAPEEMQRRIDADLRGSGQALVGRLLLYDALAARFDIVKYRRAKA